MKKLFAVLGALLLGTAAYATTIQSFNGTGANSTTVEHTWDDSGNYTANGTVTANKLKATSYTSLGSLTTTQINALAAPAGSIVFCSNCNSPQVCVSTAAATYSFTLSTGTACK